MKIQINSDHNVVMTEGLSDHIQTTIEQTLHNCKDQVTRIEVHLSDENGNKSSTNDKRCLIEARLAGRKPMVVTDHADSFHQVISGAADKLQHALERILDKEHDHHPRISGEAGIYPESENSKTDL